MKKEISVLAQRAANKMTGYIKDQVKWIKEQEEKLADAILGLNSTGYDLRQLVTGIKIGQETLNYLKIYFEQFVGISYDEYCTEHPEAMKIVTPDEKLLSAMKEFMIDLNKK